jgi:branched-subunit amino acid transport protein
MVDTWFTIIVAGLLTYGTRLSFITAHGRLEMPAWFTRALSFVPVAVLSAIIVPALLKQDDMLHVSIANGRLVAGLVAVWVAWRTKNVWLTIAVGMTVLFLFQLMGFGTRS